MKNFKHFLFILMCLSSIQLMATNYYVSPGGNDSNNGTSLSTAFATLQKAHDVSLPGDVINVADGNYSQGVSISRSGNSSNWITYRSINKWGAKFTYANGYLFEIGATVNYVGYIIIDGFDLKATSEYGVGVKSDNGAHHITVRNCWIHDCGESGIQLNDGDYRVIENNITNNNAGLMYYAGSGISIYGSKKFDDLPGFHNIIRGNISHSNLNGPNTANTDGNGIIVDDLINSQQQHPFPPDLAYSGMETLVENNLCYDNGGAGIQTYVSRNITVRNNTLYNNQLRRSAETWRNNLSASYVQNVVFANNISVVSSSLRADGGSSDFSYFSYNRAIGVMGDCSNVTIHNCISYDLNNTSSSSFITDCGATFVGINNNKAATNPLFVNANLNDFTLQSTSPAIDAGTSTFGLPTLDLDENTRIQGSAVDMGCYEYSGSTISVTGVTLSPTSASINVNGTQQLSASISPSNATNQNVSWSSSNASIATVNSSGLVTGVSAGSATITVTTQDGNKTATCAVTVTSGSTTSYSVFTTQTPATSGTDGPYELGMKFQSSSDGTITKIRYYKVNDEDGSHTGRIWSSSGTQLASVSFSGETSSGWQEATLGTPLNILANTTYVVTVNSNSAYGATNNGLQSVVSNGPLSSIADGSNGIYGTINTFPTNSWQNSNYFRDVVFVSGSSTVAVTGVSVSPTSASLDVDGTQQLTATISPSNATNQNVTWSSSNSSVATVNSNGLVTAIAAGSATITVTTEDGNKTATCAVTVTAPIPDDFSIEAEDFCGNSGISSWSTGIGNIYSGNYAKYCSVDFETGYNELLFDYATSISGSISIRINSSTGQEIGTFSYSSTGGWDSYSTVAADISSSVTGTHDLFLVGVSGTLNLDQITLHYNTSKSQHLNLHELNGIQQSIAIYPNPVEDGYLHIASTLEKILEVNIFSIEGKVIRHQTTNDQKVQIELTGLQTGLYVTSILTESGSTKEKFMIK